MGNTNTTQRIPCVACNGSGHYDSSRTPRCSSCNGTGRQRVSYAEFLAWRKRRAESDRAHGLMIRDMEHDPYYIGMRRAFKDKRDGGRRHIIHRDDVVDIDKPECCEMYWRGYADEYGPEKLVAA